MAANAGEVHVKLTADVSQYVKSMKVARRSMFWLTTPGQAIIVTAGGLLGLSVGLSIGMYLTH